jgi:hypothetical protein
VASDLEESVSMSAALRGAKKFRVTTSLWGGVFKAGYILVCTAAFFLAVSSSYITSCGNPWKTVPLPSNGRPLLSRIVVGFR